MCAGTCTLSLEILKIPWSDRDFFKIKMYFDEYSLMLSDSWRIHGGQKYAFSKKQCLFALHKSCCSYNFYVTVVDCELVYFYSEDTYFQAKKN